MNKIIIMAIGALIIVGGAYAYLGGQKEVVMGDEQEVMEKETVMMDKAEEVTTVMSDDDGSMMKVGSYEAYSPDKIARAADGDVVLFFHASWCPSCRGLSANIEANMKSIPGKVTILKVDYDKEVELKKKYGVTYQHTLVQVDKDGNQIKKWSGSDSLEKVLAEIQP